jgi:hypothetical protein
MSAKPGANGGKQESGPTAGFLNTDWNPRDLPAGATTRNVVLRTADGAATSGSLYSDGTATTAVCIMHPREFMACHYFILDIVEAGFAAWSQSPRSVGNDLRLEQSYCSATPVEAGFIACTSNRGACPANNASPKRPAVARPIWQLSTCR